MSFPNTNPSPSDLLADKKWRRRHSAWLLAPILGVGALSFVGFLYIAIRVRTRKLWIAAAISGAACALAWICMALAGDLDESSGSGAKAASAESGSGWGTGVAMAVWIALIVYAVLLNRDYLRWRAGFFESRAWYHQPVGITDTAPVTNQAPAQAPGFLGVNQTDYFTAPAGPAPANPAPATSHTPPAAPPYVPPTVQTPAAPASGPVDVNSASAQDLSVTLGIDPSLAARVVTVRAGRGGFANLDDLVAAAGLQPHELLKFRGRVTFGAPTPGSTASQTSTPQAPTKRQPGGRIIDI